MNNKERGEMVKAMDYIVRSINNEDFVWSWLSVGVADGDAYSMGVEELGEYYGDDMSDLMTLFLRLMVRAWKDGGLYCDGVTSMDKTEYEEATK